MKIMGSKEYQEIKGELLMLHNEMLDLKQEMDIIRAKTQGMRPESEEFKFLKTELRAEVNEMRYALCRLQKNIFDKTVYFQDLDQTVEERYGEF